MKIPIAYTIALAATSCLAQLSIYPPPQAKNISPDTHLHLTFSSSSTIGKSGKIQVFEFGSNNLVDTLDLGIPTSPNPSGRAQNANGETKSPPPADPNDKTVYQVNVIQGVDFHFFPVIVRNNSVRVTLHNGKLQYGKKYTVRIDASVLSGGNFKGYTGDAWTFETKAAPPAKDSRQVTVAADGTGDFNTVQGAIDWLPSKPSSRTTISIRDGFYEEIVFIKNKRNVTIRGSSRDGVVVGYPNNSAFNPSKGGPSRRVAFTISNSDDIQLSSFTINNYMVGQAEALLVRGNRVVIDNMTLNGSGDALTTYGTIYFVDSKLTGHGDTILGYAAVYFLRSEIHSIGPFTWTRTPAGQHGNVFVNCTFIGVNEPLPWSVTPKNPKGQMTKPVFARLPQNGKSPSNNFPNAEMVLINAKTKNVPVEGWGPVATEGFSWQNVKFWEYNTMDMDGKKVDLSRRHKVVKVFDGEKDRKVIDDYSRPEFVLDGWKPVVDRGI